MTLYYDWRSDIFVLAVVLPLPLCARRTWSMSATQAIRATT